MTTDKHEARKPPFPHPAKYRNGDRSTDESDAPRDPSRAPGKRTLDRADDAEPEAEGRDASGEEKDTAPQQGRNIKRNHH